MTQIDIYFQIGQVYEQQKKHQLALSSYEKILTINPTHAKVLQQLGWLYHQQTGFTNQETAIGYLSKSLESDINDAQTWYFVGRCYMSQSKYIKGNNFSDLLVLFF